MPITKQIYLAGFRFNTTYEATVMALDESVAGMNATVTFSIVMPTPKPVVVHQVTSTSMVVEWDPENFDVSTISYNISRLVNAHWKNQCINNSSINICKVYTDISKKPRLELRFAAANLLQHNRVTKKMPCNKF